jgi:hypothetical protein
MGLQRIGIKTVAWSSHLSRALVWGNCHRRQRQKSIIKGNDLMAKKTFKVVKHIFEREFESP